MLLLSFRWVSSYQMRTTYHMPILPRDSSLICSCWLNLNYIKLAIKNKRLYEEHEKNCSIHAKAEMEARDRYCTAFWLNQYIYLGSNSSDCVTDVHWSKGFWSFSWGASSSLGVGDQNRQLVWVWDYVDLQSWWTSKLSEINSKEMKQNDSMRNAPWNFAFFLCLCNALTSHECLLLDWLHGTGTYLYFGFTKVIGNCHSRYKTLQMLPNNH